MILTVYWPLLTRTCSECDSQQNLDLILIGMHVRIWLLIRFPTSVPYLRGDVEEGKENLHSQSSGDSSIRAIFKVRVA